MKSDLSLLDIRRANVARSQAWHQESEAWTVSDWATAFAGESGEVCDAVKKLRRIECKIKARKGPFTREEAIEEIGAEMADTLLYLDLLANHLGINLADAVAKKFNEVSEREEFPQRLHTYNVGEA